MTDLQWARISSDAFNVTLFAYLAAMVGYFAYLAFRREWLWKVSRAVACAGLAANIVSIVARGFAANRVPWGNMYEYSVMLAMLVVAGYLIIVEGMYKVRTLGGFALMFSVLTMAVAVSFLYVGPGPLVPALNSYWIKIHVQAAIWGSSLFALGGIVTILYLVQDWRERRQVEALRGSGPPPIMGGALDLDLNAPDDLDRDVDEVPVAAAAPRASRLPSAQTLDRVAYRIIAFAFPIWTFAVIAGAIWAQEAWGRYWGWDPKETWSFITWTIFAGYLHARATSGWKGRRAAVIALVGFVSLLVTYYVVNLWIVGLHSYAK
ncbi:MAG TPA: c-type cytochrome biogenesis protein CcsB [Actinomycetota bacterium]|jgi:cytochrome c-type biogenesis protein CcsB|nr:c-type cytochrome biogenesis protein CcsB [Actinomycetota bacterium]